LPRRSIKILQPEQPRETLAVLLLTIFRVLIQPHWRKESDMQVPNNQIPGQVYENFINNECLLPLKFFAECGTGHVSISGKIF